MNLGAATSHALWRGVTARRADCLKQHAAKLCYAFVAGSAPAGLAPSRHQGPSYAAFSLLCRTITAELTNLAAYQTQLPADFDAPAIMSETYHAAGGRWCQCLAAPLRA